MALVPISLIPLTVLLHFVAAQKTNGSVSVGASITATTDAKPWLSSSGEFAFGFKKIEGKDDFLLSIWYDKIPEKTIIWYPEGGPTVSTGSKVDLLDGRGLVLSDPQGKEVWSSASISDLAYGYMNDTGNFVIVGSNSRNIWESFNYPANTLLPTQVMGRGGSINSRMGKTNFTGGRFQLRLLEDGNLVLNTRDTFYGSAGNVYYNTGTNDESDSSNSGIQLVFDATGYMYVLTENGQTFNLTTKDSLPSGDYYQLPLANGNKDPSENVKAFLKYRKINGPPGTGENKCGTGKNKVRRTLIFVGSVLLSASVLGIVLLIGVIYVCFLQIHKKARNSCPSSTTIETNLARFTYQELVAATDGFKNELGKGAFGTVYKGVMGTKIVVLKKLETLLPRASLQIDPPCFGTTF